MRSDAGRKLILRRKNFSYLSSSGQSGAPRSLLAGGVTQSLKGCNNVHNVQFGDTSTHREKNFDTIVDKRLKTVGTVGEFASFFSRRVAKNFLHRVNVLQGGSHAEFCSSFVDPLSIHRRPTGRRRQQQQQQYRPYRPRAWGNCRP